MDYIQRMKWLSLFIWNACNLRCGFCYGDKERELNQNFYNIDRIKDDLDKYKKEYYTVVVWGGEPLMHPNIMEILDYISDCWYKLTSIVTNWIRLSDKEFTRQLLLKDIWAFFVSSHSNNNKIEDVICKWKGILDKKIIWIKNLLYFRTKLKKNFEININITLNIYNTYNIVKIVLYYSDLVDYIRISFNIIVDWYSKKNYIFLPKYENIVKSFYLYNKEFNNVFLKKRLSIHWAPLCISYKLQELNIVIREVSRLYINDFSNKEWLKLYDDLTRSKTKLKQCSECFAYWKFCFWVYNKYIEKYWYKEFTSFSKDSVYNIIRKNNSISREMNNN